MEVSKILEDISCNCIKLQKKFFPKNSIITSYMQKRNQICLLVSGKADLIRYDLKGNKDIIDRFSNNDVFGEAFYPVNTNNELFVLAAEDCEVIIFLYDDIRTKCRNSCRFHNILILNILELILNNNVHQNTRIEILSKRTIREKLLTYFSILSASNTFSKTVSLTFSLTNLADYLSVDRSAMMREIKNLVDEGFITKNGNKIKLLY